MTRAEALAALRDQALFASAMREDADFRSGNRAPIAVTDDPCQSVRGWTADEWNEQQDAKRRGELAGGEQA